MMVRLIGRDYRVHMRFATLVRTSPSPHNYGVIRPDSATFWL